MKYITENITDHGGGEIDNKTEILNYIQKWKSAQQYCRAYSSHLLPEEGTRGFFYDLWNLNQDFPW